MEKAIWPRSAFRDNYLAAVITIAALFSCFNSTAQSGPTRSQLQQVNALGYDYNSASYRKLFYVPLDTLSTADSGAIAFKNRVFYLKQPTKWVPWGKVVQITDSSFKVGEDTITIHGTGGGGSATIANAGGAGDTLWNGSAVKRLDHDATLTFSTNGNKISQAVDTLNWVASIPRVRDTAATLRSICQWPAERTLGTLYEKSSWINTSDFTPVGTIAPALNGQYIDLTGGNGTFGANYVTVLTPTALSKSKMTAIIKLTGTLTGSSGLALGLKYINSNAQYDILASFSFSTALTTPIYIANSGATVFQTSAGSLTFAQNDVIKIVVEFKDSAFIATADNLTNPSSVTTTYTIANPAAGAGISPNRCYFAIYNTAGTQQLQSLKIESAETQFPSLLLEGDSKTQLGFATAFTTRIGPRLNTSYPSVVTHAGEGDGVEQSLASIDEIKRIGARVIINNIGSNSLRQGKTFAQVVSAYDSLTTLELSTGAIVYHIVMPEDTVDNVVNAVGMTELKNYIAGKFGSNYISGVWDTLSDGTNRLKAAFDNGDGIHINQAAVDAVVAKIVQFGIPICTSGRLADGNFVAAHIASTSASSASVSGTDNYILKKSGSGTANSQVYDNSTNIGIGTTSPLVKLHISGNNSSNSQLKIGTFEGQSTSDNNGFWSNNGFFNGTAWQYRNAGGSSILQFSRDTMFIYNLPTNTAGGTDDPSLYRNYKFGPVEFLSLKPVKATASIAGAFGVTITNTSNSASASAPFGAVNDVGNFINFGMRSSAGSSYGIFGNNTALLYASTPGNMGLMVDNATGYIDFATGGNTQRMKIAADGTVSINGLAGSGTRMVTADASGNLDATTVPPSYTFTNGLTNSSGTVSLGGSLTGNTDISGGVDLSFGVSGTDLISFKVAATTTDIQSAIITKRSNPLNNNYTISSSDYVVVLDEITGNKTLTLPTATNGRWIIVQNMNSNADADIWSFNTPVKGKDAGDITNLANLSIYWLQADGTNWRIMMAY